MIQIKWFDNEMKGINQFYQTMQKVIILNEWLNN